jgi:hypothetical protein
MPSLTIIGILFGFLGFVLGLVGALSSDIALRAYKFARLCFLGCTILLIGSAGVFDYGLPWAEFLSPFYVAASTLILAWLCGLALSWIDQKCVMIDSIWAHK